MYGRIDEAARYLPVERLALGPECGFYSTSAGNLLTEDELGRKLELVVETARWVWGVDRLFRLYSDESANAGSGLPSAPWLRGAGVARRAVLARWKLHR